MIKIIKYIFDLCLLAALASGCAGQPNSGPLETPELMPVPLDTPNPRPLASTELFIETDAVVPVPTATHIARSRFVRINFDLLLDETGQPRILEANREITLNLFPDVIYTGVIGQTTDDGGTYSWVGHLKDIEYSELTMVYTGGVFIGHFASPAGVYEVSSVGDDLYHIILIDQQKLQGGEG